MREVMPIISASTGLHQTPALLTSRLPPQAKPKEDMLVLRDVFSEKSLCYLLKIHEKLNLYVKQSPSPVLRGASRLAEGLAEELQSGRLEDDERELLLLISKPHLKAVLSAHDAVAQKNFDTVLPPLPENGDDDLEDESVKIIRLVKNKEPLGATIRRDGATGAVIVARIMRGGAADRSGLVHVGDELREINGNPITHKRPDEISQILSQSQGSITLKIIPAAAEEDKLKPNQLYLKALFDYVPSEDAAAPCQEAGLRFHRGDILQVVSREDATWWQAKRVGDMRAGLIPSAHFQERRLRLRWKMGSILTLVSPRPTAYDGGDGGDCDSGNVHNGEDVASLRRSPRLRAHRLGSPGGPCTPGDDHLLIYEEVAQHLPRPGERPRLVVLVGSLGARISELKQKVIAENPHRYGLAVPHTTRVRKSHEREGVEYHFITRASFQADVLHNQFIEYGKYKDHFYGTSLESIRQVLRRNKVCVVDVQPEALKTLRNADFKPYVIFVRPRVGDCRRKWLSSTSSLSSGVTDDDLQEMKQSAEQMEERCGQWVDYVLVKEDPVSALVELQVVLERMQLEPQWMPVSWLRS